MVNFERFKKGVFRKKLYKAKRWLVLRFNRFRINYSIQKQGKFPKIVIPEHHRKKVKVFKYILTAAGLLLGLVVFSSVLIGFGLGVLIWLLSSLLQSIVFKHSYLFVHALPDFEIDPNKWAGCGFGFALPDDSEEQIPLISMMITDLEYAKNLSSLFLAWTGGKHIDRDKNIRATVVVTKPNEYNFFLYPNPKRPIANRFFQSARDRLRQSSLSDEVSERHMSLVLGKICSVGRDSYFPQFRKRYRNGIPVMFEFLLPPFDTPTISNEIKSMVLFDFEIKDKSELTRQDIVYDMIEGLEVHKGHWQGPPDLEPK